MITPDLAKQFWAHMERQRQHNYSVLVLAGIISASISAIALYLELSRPEPRFAFAIFIAGFVLANIAVVIASARRLWVRS